jgi:hypothetical protein
MSFMRLSLTKAAHAAVAWCRVQDIQGISLVFCETNTPVLVLRDLVEIGEDAQD